MICWVIRDGGNVVYANPDKTIEKTYGVWLRARTRNAKPNTNSLWLRNVPDSGASRKKQDDKRGASTTVSGDDKAVVKFKDIDRIMRKILEDNESVKIVEKDQGAKITGQYVQNQGEIVLGKKLNENE